MAERQEQCRLCKWWDWERARYFSSIENVEKCSDSDRGNCQRHAPVIALVVTTMHFDNSPTWPYTRADHWCGDWESRNPTVREKHEAALDKMRHSQ